jgi:hypothetical protein
VQVPEVEICTPLFVPKFNQKGSQNMKEEKLAKLKTLYQEGHREIILVTLHLAGISDRLIDYISDGLWSRRQALIGTDLSDKYKKGDAG